ncbi:hypothetical protein MATL_G00198560 [Megalops atlanticus]|uniref:Uncharacterized protein n=1 Tax=Megalops atlanticus TaxID=7932 RepID=A0A9D3PKH7_MEGAT|nr:hypothetical protein MATL_G00198560 [Megalops atlanticus]
MRPGLDAHLGDRKFGDSRQGLRRVSDRGVYTHPDRPCSRGKQTDTPTVTHTTGGGSRPGLWDEQHGCESQQRRT